MQRDVRVYESYDTYNLGKREPRGSGRARLEKSVDGRLLLYVRSHQATSLGAKTSHLTIVHRALSKGMLERGSVPYRDELDV